MFRPLPNPGSKPQFFELAHLNSETMQFVINLRSANDDYEEFLKSLSPEERKLVEAENKTRKSERPCAREDCNLLKTESTVKLLENAKIRKKIEKLKEYLGDVLESQEEISIEFQKHNDEHNRLEMTADGLQDREKLDLKPKLKEIAEIRRQLERKIDRAKRDISKLIESKGSNVSIENTVSSDLDQDDQFMNNNCETKQKHTGTYTIRLGVKEWSCCKREDKNTPGCTDDHSVGLISTLMLNYKEAHRPYTQSNRIREKQKLVNLAEERHTMREKVLSHSKNRPTSSPVYKSTTNLNNTIINNSINNSIINTSSIINNSVNYNSRTNSMSKSVQRESIATLSYSDSVQRPRSGSGSGIMKCKPNNLNASHSVHFLGTALENDLLPSPSMYNTFNNNISKTYNLNDPIEKLKAFQQSKVGEKLRTSLNSGSILALNNHISGGTKKVGKMRCKGDESIERIGGRPLTANKGTHLIMQSTNNTCGARYI